MRRVALVQYTFKSNLARYISSLSFTILRCPMALGLAVSGWAVVLEFVQTMEFRILHMVIFWKYIWLGIYDFPRILDDVFPEDEVFCLESPLHIFQQQSKWYSVGAFTQTRLQNHNLICPAASQFPKSWPVSSHQQPVCWKLNQCTNREASNGTGKLPFCSLCF